MTTNFKSHLDNKKAYLQIDFAFAIFIFIILFLFVNSYYKNQLDSYTDSIIINDNNYNARDLCNFIKSTPGNPIGWESDLSNANFVGLKNEDSFSFSSTKLNSFNSTNYFSISDILDINAFFHIVITGINSNNNYLDFGVSPPIVTSYTSRYSCFSFHNSEPVEIVVEVWR